MRKTKKGKVGSLSVMADGPEPSPAALNTHEATEEAAGHNMVSFHVADGTGGSTELRSLGATMFGSRTVLISPISPRSSPHSSEPALASASPAVLDTVAVVEAAALSAASGDSPNNVKCQSPAPNRELHSVSPPTPSTVASANKTPQLFCPLPADAAFASLGEKSCMSHIVESATPSPTLEPLSPEARSSKKLLTRARTRACDRTHARECAHLCACAQIRTGVTAHVRSHEGPGQAHAHRARGFHA